VLLKNAALIIFYYSSYYKCFFSILRDVDKHCFSKYINIIYISNVMTGKSNQAALFQRVKGW